MLYKRVCLRIADRCTNPQHGVKPRTFSRERLWDPLRAAERAVVRGPAPSPRSRHQQIHANGPQTMERADDIQESCGAPVRQAPEPTSESAATASRAARDARDAGGRARRGGRGEVSLCDIRCAPWFCYFVFGIGACCVLVNHVGFKANFQALQ